MKKIYAFVFFITPFLSLAQDGWTTLTTPHATRYDDVYFINPNVGWTAGGWLKKIHKTIDGGETWQESGTFTKYLRSIEFFDEKIGLCGSLEGSLYRTTDGGKTWKDVAPKISPQPAGVCGLAKADATTIYGVGIWSEPAFVIKSVDKGLTWTYINMSAYANSLIDAYFIDADHGFVTGSKSEEDGGIVLYTADGGATWQEKFVTHHVSDRIWKIQTPDKKHFYGSIESYTDSTRIIRSKDAGQTWEIVTVDTGYYYCQTVGFIDSLRGWTGGYSTLFETNDGGETWEKITLGSAYNRFVKLNDRTAFLTGNRVYKFSRDFVTGVTDTDPYDPIHHVSVSPNPTPGMANLRVTFGTSTMAHIYLYSTQGKNLNKLFDGRVEQGEKTFPIDLTTQAAQTFVIIVKTNEGMEQVKLMKQ